MDALPVRKWWVRLASNPASWCLLTALLTFIGFPLSRSYQVLSGWLVNHEVWLWIAMLTPALGGAILVALSRRFWAWPYAYLIALWLAPATPTEDFIDLGVLIANATLLMLSVALAEGLGLSLGRWFSRMFALGYFLVAGLTLLVISVIQLVASHPGWKAVFYLVCGGLYFLQAWLQSRKLAMLKQHQDREPTLPAPPLPIRGAENLPWTVRVDGMAHRQARQLSDTQSASKNEQNQVR